MKTRGVNIVDAIFKQTDILFTNCGGLEVLPLSLSLLAGWLEYAKL